MYKRHNDLFIWTFAIFAVYNLVQAGNVMAANDPIIFHDVQQQTKEFLQYEELITLTPEQEETKYQALSEIPAPCCSDFSIDTCCCRCNLARSVWGLSKFLISEYEYNAAQVQEAVIRWIHAINPNGFSGKACYTGGCGRTFKNDGCGGMYELKF